MGFFNRHTLWRGLALLAVLLAGLSVRLTGYDAVFAGPPRPTLIDPDSYYHARRIAKAAEAFPALPPFWDPLINHPQGYHVRWPPAFDYLAGALTRLLGLPPMNAGIWLVVLLGACAAAVPFAFARRLGLGFGGALIAGMLAACFPICVEYTRVGRIDHHVLEPMLTTLAALLALWCIESTEAPQRRTAALLAGLSLGLCIWSWVSALFPVGVLVSGLLIHDYLSRPGAGCRDAALCLLLGTAILTALPICLAAPADARFSLEGPSWAHLLLLGLALACGAWLILCDRLSRRRQSPRGYYLAGPLGATTLVIAGVLCSPLRQTLALAVAFGSRSGLYGLILEQRALLSLPLRHLVLLGTYFVFAVPLLCLLAIANSRRPREIRAMLAVWASSLLLAGFLQLRFLPIALVLSAPLCADGLRAVATALGKLLLRTPLRSRANALSTAIVLALVVSSFQPALPYLITERQVPTPLDRDKVQAVELLGRLGRAQTRPGATDAPQGVMTQTSDGNLVAAVAALPVVGTALIHPATDQANRDAMTFFTATDVREADDLLTARAIRWVLVTALPRTRFEHLRAHLGRPVPANAALLAFRSATAVRLLADRGAPITVGSVHLGGFRQLQQCYEGPLSPRGLPQVALYRRVPGATLSGHARPGSQVTLEIQLQTNRGYRFAYRDESLADGSGQYQFRVPYATETHNRRCYPATGTDLTRPIGPALLRNGPKTTRVAIACLAVLDGRVAPVPE